MNYFRFFNKMIEKLEVGIQRATSASKKNWLKSNFGGFAWQHLNHKKSSKASSSSHCILGRVATRARDPISSGLEKWLYNFCYNKKYNIEIMSLPTIRLVTTAVGCGTYLLKIIYIPTVAVRLATLHAMSHERGDLVRLWSAGPARMCNLALHHRCLPRLGWKMVWCYR